jgi:hypothetical protein
VLRRYATFIVHHRVAVMLAAAAITVFFFTRIGNLRVVVDPNDNLPQEHPYVVASNEIERVFGGRNLAVIGVESASGDVFQPAVLAKIQRITDGVLEIPGVIRSNVISLAARKAKDITGTEEGMVVRQLMETVPQTPREIEQLKKAVYANPIYVNSIVSRDGRMALIIADFTSGKGFKGYRPIKEAIEKVVDKERDDSVKIYLSGISINLAWLEIYSQQMIVLFFTALAIVIVISYLSFWSIQGTIVPVMTGLISVIWGLGVMGLLRIPMDTFNATTPILIMAIAHGHSVQILKRYYEEYARLHDSSAAVIESLARVGPVMLTAGSMAVASFLALTAFPTLTIRVFGIFTAIGVLAAMIVEMTFVPSFRSMIPAPKRYEIERERMRDVFDRFLEKISTCVVAGCGRAIFGTLLVFLVLLAVGIKILHIDNSLKGNFSPHSQVRRDDIPLNAGMGGTNTLYLLIEGPGPDAIKNPSALRAMEAVQQHLEQTYKVVGKTQSLADFMKKMNKAMNADESKEDRLPDTRELNAQYLLLYSMSGDPGDFDTYVDYEYRSAVIWAYLKTDSTAVIEEIIADLRPFVAQHFPPGYKVSIGGGMAQGAALNEVMVRGKLLNIASIAASIYVISSVVLRSALAGFFVLIPLTLAVLANFGVMGLAGIRLDIGTAAVSAMAVGVGADYAIYLIYRLREEMARHGNPDRAVTRTLATAGKAVTFVALAVGSGYSVLMLGGLGMHQRLGFLVAVAMAVSCLAAIALLPAILHRVKPRFAFGNGAAAADRSTVPAS